MHVKVNGVRLFVEVLSAKLRPEGARMREVPTVLALHGGPLDHSHMRDWVSPFCDVAQVVLYDHRGCGRSEAGDPALWTMAQWGDDVVGVCDALGIEKPIVVGCSFGSFVAQSYAGRHPGHAARLVFMVAGVRHNDAWSMEGFRKQGGDVAAEAYAAVMRGPTPETMANFLAACRHLYNVRRVVDADEAARAVVNPKLVIDYFGRECKTFDLRAGLANVRVPVLVLGGEEDPIMPPPFQAETERALVNAKVTRVSFPNAGHQLHTDVPEAYAAALRGFVTAVGAV
jgi:proline iminopeptidase